MVNAHLAIVHVVNVMDLLLLTAQHAHLRRFSSTDNASASKAIMLIATMQGNAKSVIKLVLLVRVLYQQIAQAVPFTLSCRLLKHVTVAKELTETLHSLHNA